MSETRATRSAARRFIFVGLCLFLLLLRLLPAGDAVSVWPGPDLMLCLIIAWVLRRPTDLPFWFLAPVLLLADILLMRPPGLWTVLVLCACEFLRRRQSRVRALPFPGELALVTLLVSSLVIANWAILTVLQVKQSGLAEQLRLVPITLLAYPLVVMFLHGILGVRKQPAPEGFGTRVSP